MALFTPNELETYLHYSVPEDQAVLVERVTSGWLLNQVGIVAWPTWDSSGLVPETLWGLALELAGIVHENPTALVSESSATQSTTWGKRREEIAAEVRAWASVAGLTHLPTTGSLLPGGSFPQPGGWPDPANTVPTSAGVFLADGVRDAAW